LGSSSAWLEHQILIWKSQVQILSAQFQFFFHEYGRAIPQW
jgi:hypothetical protein